jgi:hypothetical protein
MKCFNTITFRSVFSSGCCSDPNLIRSLLTYPPPQTNLSMYVPQIWNTNIWISTAINLLYVYTFHSHF